MHDVAFPTRLYPAFAPVPPAFANHLAVQEWKQKRVVARRRPAPEVIHTRILSRIADARDVVYEYLSPFVLVDKQQGPTRSFPQSDWLLDTLAAYTPTGKRPSIDTLDYWIKRGILRREHARGPFDLTSVAALLITRIAEERLERNWRATSLAEQEARWWCYGQCCPASALTSVPMPLELVSRPLLLRTPWLGVLWEDNGWMKLGDLAYRWTGLECAEDLSVWDTAIAQTIIDGRSDPLLGQPQVQHYLVQEAGKLLLERLRCEKGTSS